MTTIRARSLSSSDDRLLNLVYLGHDDQRARLEESCARVCQALDWGLNGRQMDDLSRSVLGAIEQELIR